MATFQSFATTASNVAVDNNARTITTSNEVVEIDGELDAPTGGWDGWTITCQSSGGFRSTSGASGTLGGGRHALKIVEKGNGHRFGGDNFSGSNGANARFAGDGTNTLIYSNILWIVEDGDRSDFDWGRGAQSNGSAGPKVVMTGVRLIQLSAAGSAAHFNHYSGQVTIRNHPQVGYGLRIANYSNGHVLEFATAIQSTASVEGLVIDNVTATNNDGNPAGSSARVAVRLAGVPTNGSLTLSNLNTPNITDVDGSSDKTLLLIDPVGLPSITDNWGRHVNIEVQRHVPFSFPNAEPAGETMHARAQTAGGAHATASMSGATGRILVRTQRTASVSATAWTNYNTYRFFMTGLGFRKYSLNTNQTIANVPATITAALTADVLPDGTAISAIAAPTSQNPPDNLSEVLRAIKGVEAQNPVTTNFPTSSLAYVEGDAVKIHSSFSLILDSGESSLITLALNNPLDQHIELKAGSTLSASNGLTTIDATGTGETITLDEVTEDDDVFMLDSTGQKSVISVTNAMGGSVLFSLVKVSDASTAGSATIASGATGSFSIATKGLGSGYKLVGKRPGYSYFSADVNLTGGGLREFTAPAQAQILQPSGSASYVAGVTVPATLTIAVSNSSGMPAARVECGDATFSARQIFKAWEDAIAGSSGASFMGLGGAQITYIESALKGNEIVLGAHTKVKRKASTDVNATIRATLYAPDDAPVDDANGDVQTIEGLDIPAVASAIITSTDFDPTESGTQSVWGKLNDIETAIDGIETGGGGGGGGATAQQIWEYSSRSLSTSPPTASAIATAVWGSDDAVSEPPTSSAIATAVSGALTIPSASQNATAVWGASSRTTTDPTPPTASAIATAVWGTDLDPNLNGLQDIRTAIRKLNTLTTSAIASAVWSSDDVVSAADISEEVWSTIVDGGITTDLTITPEAEAGDGFRIPADDAALISNGDPFQFTNTGGYSNISTTETYYAYVASNVLYVYGSRHNAVTPGSPWIQPSGGTIGNVRIVFVGQRPVGTAGVALHRILAAIVELDSNHDSHSEATAAIAADIDTLMGEGFVEDNIGIQRALRIILAVLAGRSRRNLAGTTHTFHRLDSASTSIVQADVSDTGRSLPTLDPDD